MNLSPRRAYPRNTTHKYHKLEVLELGFAKEWWQHPKCTVLDEKEPAVARRTPESMENSVFQSQLAHPHLELQFRAIRKPGEVIYSQNITMCTAQLSVFLITLSYAKKRGDATPHSPCANHRACKTWGGDGAELLREVQRCVNLLLSTGAGIGTVAKDGSAFQSPATPGSFNCSSPLSLGWQFNRYSPTLLCRGWVEQREGATSCSISSPAQLENHCLLLSACSF